jgi:hypothetical protein
MCAALPPVGTGCDQDRYIMSRNIHPHRQCRSPTPVISGLGGARSRTARTAGSTLRMGLQFKARPRWSPPRHARSSAEPLTIAQSRAHLRNGNVEISIALAAPPCLTSRGFLHRKLSDAGPSMPAAALATGPASETLHDNRHARVRRGRLPWLACRPVDDNLCKYCICMARNAYGGPFAEGSFLSLRYSIAP